MGGGGGGGDQLSQGGTVYSTIDGPTGTRYSAVDGPGGPLLGGNTYSITIREVTEEHCY